jgi:SAM-dependent methyltransferase
MAEAGPGKAPGFSDHFSGHADLYKSYRPGYPAALFEAIAEHSPATEAAWDCACGNGQASIGLAEKFDVVHATDASARQIEGAEPHPRIRYSVAPAEDSGLAGHSVDAVLVAQALHWFDIERFYDEVERVVRPGGLFVAVGYAGHVIAPEIDAITLHLSVDVLGRYWPWDSRHLETRYSDIPKRFPAVDMPDLTITVDWTLDRLMGYFSSWSALQRYRQETGNDPLPEIRAEMAKVWGDPAEPHRVTWPLVIMAGRAG